MVQLILIPILAVTVSLLVWAEFRQAQNQVYVLKPASTVLVIVVALLSFATPGSKAGYTLGISLGLLFSLGGDVALMFKSNRAFSIGLVLFLLAHVIYAAVLTLYNGFYFQDLITGAVLLVFAASVYLFLRPDLGSMQAPVIAYILIICFMVNRAASTLFGTAFTTTQAWLLTFGAVLFMLSDLILAINRFGHPFRYHRLGLFLYYGGQLLIALSPSYFV